MVATLGVVVVAGVGLSFVFRGPGGVGAVWTSAAVAFVVQIGAFGLGGLVGPRNLQAKMGIGALLRLAALVAYAVLAVAAIKLPLAAALVSLATFFFLTTVLEPLLIKQ